MQTAVLLYLTTDPVILGLLSWISLLVTTLGLGVALWQIMKVKRAALAAKDAATDLARTVRNREQLLQLNSGLSQLEQTRNHLSKGSRDAALICLELSTSAIIGARELSLDPAEERRLQKLMIRLRRAADVIEPIADDREFMATVIRLREISIELRTIAVHRRYEYHEGEQ